MNVGILRCADIDVPKPLDDRLKVQLSSVSSSGGPEFAAEVCPTAVSSKSIKLLSVDVTEAPKKASATLSDASVNDRETSRVSATAQSDLDIDCPGTWQSDGYG